MKGLHENIQENLIPFRKYKFTELNVSEETIDRIYRTFVRSIIYLIILCIYLGRFIITRVFNDIQGAVYSISAVTVLDSKNIKKRKTPEKGTKKRRKIERGKEESHMEGKKEETSVKTDVS